MSIITGIKALFTTQKSVDKALDIGDKITTGVISGIDKLWHTEEEKSDARQKGSDTLLKFWDVTSKENTEQSKARRELAKMFSRTYLSLLVVAAPVYGFDKEYAKFLLELAGNLTGIMLMIAAIYFGPQQISKIWKKK